MTKKLHVSLADFIRENRQDFPRHTLQALARWQGRQNPAFLPCVWLDYIDGRGGPNPRRVNPNKE